MDNFQSGFAHELVEIMAKEAASSRKAQLSKIEKFLANSEKAKGLGRTAGRGAKSVAIGAAVHKLVNPDATMGSATRSGIGMAGGGKIGVSLAKQLGLGSAKGKVISGVLGSALGIRAMRSGKRSKEKYERELLEKVLSKEAQKLVATRDVTTGATPSVQQPKADPSKILTDSSGARGTAAQLAENKAAGLRQKKQTNFESGVKGLVGKIQGAAKSWGSGWGSGGAAKGSPVTKASPVARSATRSTRTVPTKSPTAKWDSTKTTNAQRFAGKGIMP
jgi:hypothetical protein